MLSSSMGSGNVTAGLVNLTLKSVHFDSLLS